MWMKRYQIRLPGLNLVQPPRLQIVFSAAILWFFRVTFWAGAYLLLERVFCTIEFPREKTMNRFAEVY